MTHSHFVTADARRMMLMNIRKHPLVRKIEAQVEQTLADFDYELVQLKFGGDGGGRTLTVLMDSPEGVSSQDCQDMMRRLSMLFDVLDPIPGAYTLVVSSPGFDRPLTRDSDFERFAGRQAAIRHTPTGGQRRTVSGVLAGVDGEEALLETEEGVLRIPLTEVEEAHLIYDWDTEQAR